MDGLTHDDHHHHGHHLHLLDIHVLLRALAGGHRVPHGGWPGAGPVDSHVEAGLSLIHCLEGDGLVGQEDGGVQAGGRWSQLNTEVLKKVMIKPLSVPQG